MTFDWISFTTDYGVTDGFVAACHGMIARIAPRVRVIDITHLVPPGDVRRGAAVLAQTVPSLPLAVHLGVVDPGVGTARRPVAVETNDGSILVGPDNGLLPPAALALGGIRRTVELTNAAWFAPIISMTFHGRDVFAPASAHLALGADLTLAGPEIPDLVLPEPPTISTGAGWIRAEVLTVDRFGNVQLAARGDLLTRLGRALTVDGVEAVRVATFGAAPPGALLVFEDSAGYATIAVNGGNAADILTVAAGDVVYIEGI